ncbi:MAG: BNR repeat-containing protein, partial [Trueperaceae bacterium]|nr:BNR repeat-containing protein [Trueperaceae bacterium]
MSSSNYINVAKGWAKTSVNATIFRRNSIVTHKDTQYIGFYEGEGFMVLGKRRLGSSTFNLHKTQYQGNVNDAHNVISIMVDGDGFLHVAFDHHVSPLRYAKSLEAGGLELSKELPMTGRNETNVTYPEFYRLSDGNMLFMYRDGSSGRGDLVLNHYDIKTKIWTQRQNCLIDGEGERNAYWQAYIDP